jgi:long-chain fatty acid transport protein
MTARLLAIATVPACLLALRAPAAHANPADYFGFGARSVGLGGAATALANDFSANYYNPAGLSTRKDLELTLGYAMVSPTLTLNGEDLDVDGVNGVQGGVIMRGQALGRTLALSLGLHLPNERITRLRALPELQPRFALYDNHPQRLILTTSVAMEIIPDTLHVGFGLTYLSDTRGRLNVAGQVDLFDANGTTMISAVDVNFEAVRYPSAGIVWTPVKPLRIGLAWREEFDLSLDIGVVVNGDIITGGATGEPSPLVEDAQLAIVSQNSNLFSPRQLALGFAWEEENFAIAVDFTWMQWSRFKSPTALLTTELDAGDLPLSIPPNPQPTPPRFRDIVVPRFGAEGCLFRTENVQLIGRGGLWWENSPARVQRGATNLVDGPKVGASLGFTLTFTDITDVFPKPFHLDFAAQGLWMAPRTHEKDNPADPIGDYESAGHFLGFTTNLRFDL